MLINYLKIAFRQMRLFKTYSFINIIGLSIGLAASFIILLYILYQVSYDRYNEKLDNIYVVTKETKAFNWVQPLTPLILAPTLKNEYPEVEEYARWSRGACKITYKEKVFEETRCTYSDPEIFKILTLPLISGDFNSLKKERDFLVLSETMAKKYFNNNNPIGEIVSLDYEGTKYDLKILGVMKDIPSTSTFKTDFITPLYIREKSMLKFFPDKNIDDILTSWDMSFFVTYVLLSPTVQRADFDKKVVDFSRRYSDTLSKSSYALFPVKDIYFNSASWVNNRFPTNSISNVYIYSTAAFLILFIACVNYIMLNLGKASLRTKEIGVRKVIGALRFDLFKQNIIEAIVIAFISLPLALMLVQILLPDISPLLGVKISADYFHNLKYILLFLFITILIGMIAGSYISVYLSGLSPINIFKNRFNIGQNKAVFRKILMITQMIIFVGLILSSVIIYKQMQYLINKNFGYNKEQLVVFYADDLRFGERFSTFKNELLNQSDIIKISAASYAPGTDGRSVSRIGRKDNPDQKVTADIMSVEKDFIETMETKIILGESFKNTLPIGEEGSDKKFIDCIINETGVKELGIIENPIGEIIDKYRIIGVVKDFNLHSLREKIGPVIITHGSKYLHEIIVRLKPGNIPNTLKLIQDKSKEFNNGKPMGFDFFDERLKALYLEEQNFQKVVGYATTIAIFIACLGIFGISLFICQQRVKEIGIRKVLGASVKNIYFILTKEYIILLLLSSIIAFPLSYSLIDKWLQSFEYKTSIDFWIFVLSYVLALFIVVITVSIRALMAIRTNPVESLRYE